jgi:hypothetical protein
MDVAQKVQHRSDEDEDEDDTALAPDARAMSIAGLLRALRGNQK